MENLENTRIYTEVKVGTLANPTAPTRVSSVAVTAAKVVDEYAAAKAANDPGKVDT